MSPGDRERRVLEAIPLVRWLVRARFRTVPAHLASSDDLAQIALVAVISSVDRWNPARYAWSGYVLLRARCAILDELRRLRRQITVPLGEWDAADGDDAYARVDERDRCLRLLARERFEPRERKLLAMLGAGALQMDIAAALGMSEATVSRMIARIANRLYP